VRSRLRLCAFLLALIASVFSPRRMRRYVRRLHRQPRRAGCGPAAERRTARPHLRRRDENAGGSARRLPDPGAGRHAANSVLLAGSAAERDRDIPSVKGHKFVKLHDRILGGQRVEPPRGGGNSALQDRAAVMQRRVPG